MKTRYLVRTVNEFRDLDDIRGLVVVSRDGRDIKLRDIGEVRAGYKDRDVITRVDGREAVEVEVYKEADANIVDMAQRVTDVAVATVQPRIKREFGADIDLLTDRSLFIESSIDEVLDTAINGGLLAIIVLFLFLRDKSTLIVAVSIPISVLGVTFAPLNLAGVSLNIMSLGGLALGIGMNFRNIMINPHGNGTHTECAGHITAENLTINQTLKQHHFTARLVSVNAIKTENEDLVITCGALISAVDGSDITEAIIIRTLPNGPDKKTMDSREQIRLTLKQTPLNG